MLWCEGSFEDPEGEAGEVEEEGAEDEGALEGLVGDEVCEGCHGQSTWPVSSTLSRDQLRCSLCMHVYTYVRMYDPSQHAPISKLPPRLLCDARSPPPPQGGISHPYNGTQQPCMSS